MSYLWNSLRNIGVNILAIVQFPFVYPRLYTGVMDAIEDASLTAFEPGEKESETFEAMLYTPSFLRQSRFAQRRRVIGKSETTKAPDNSRPNSKSNQT